MGFKKYIALAIVCVCMFSLVTSENAFGRRIRKEEIIQTEVLDGFENLADWSFKASEHADKARCGIKLLVGKPGSLVVTRGKEENFLGIKAAFRRKGYNYIEIIPKAEIPIPGKVTSVDVWVWGGNYHYTLEAHLLDYRNITHVFPMGSLEYMGWKNLSAYIPGSIPQQGKYVPRFRGLRFAKFVIWTHPTERIYGFYTYLDRLKAITDVYVKKYDGDYLGNQQW